MALTRADAKEMFDEADRTRSAHRRISYRFQPQTQRSARRVDEGELGEIITGYRLLRIPHARSNNVRMDPSQGAGTTLDVGVYPLNLVAAVMGKAPKIRLRFRALR